jgi:hypothetical protein
VKNGAGMFTIRGVVALALTIGILGFGLRVAAGADAPPTTASLRKHVTVVFTPGWKTASDAAIADANRDLKSEAVLVYSAVRGTDGEAIYVLASDPGNLDSADSVTTLAALKDGKAKALESIYNRAHPDDTISDMKLERFCGSDGYSSAHYRKQDKSWLTQFTVKVPGMPMMIAQANGAKADLDVLRVLRSLCVKAP